jgi:hypothetical protein
MFNGSLSVNYKIFFNIKSFSMLGWLKVNTKYMKHENKILVIWVRQGALVDHILFNFFEYTVYVLVILVTMEY